MLTTTFANLSIRSPAECNLITPVLDQASQVLLVTAAGSGEGTTTSSLALANELALTTGDRVLLIDTSLSMNGITETQALSSRPGFLDLLLSIKPPELIDCIVQSTNLSFDFLPLGQGDPHKPRLNIDPLQKLFRTLIKEYRFVIIDGDPVYSNGDTLTLSSQVDAVVLVVCGEKTRWEVAQGAMQRLIQAQARLMGCIFNRRKHYIPQWIVDRI